MAIKNTYHKETWKLLATLKEIAPGPDLVEMTSNELLSIAGVDEAKTNRHWFIHDLRRRGLAETESPVNSGKRVKALKLTEVGHQLIDTYVNQGEAAAVAKLPDIVGGRKRKAQSGKMTRNQALIEARHTLGDEAPIDDVIRVAQFLLGE